MNVRYFLRTVTVLTVIFGMSLFPAPSSVFAESSRITFTLGTPGVSLEPSGTLLVAVGINNTSDRAALKVKIKSVRVESARLLTSVPIRVGRIEAEQSAVFQANFNGKNLTPGNQYKLVIRGTYQVRRAGGDDDDKDNNEAGRQQFTFTLRGVLSLPPASPGSAIVNTVSVSSQQVSDAPFPPQPREQEEDEVNPGGPPVPTAPFVPGTPTLTSTEVQAGPLVQSAAPAPVPFAAPIMFSANRSLGLISGTSNGTAITIAEPSGASGGGVIFATANLTAAYSTDDGATFTQLDPTTIFPADAVGYCCDQIVQYVASVDRFFWLLQGNGYRLAMASPAAIIASGGTAWTYWNLTPTVFGACTGFDYPDLSVGNNFLYMSWDAGGTGCGGLQVARTSLTGLQAGGTITIDFTDPANSLRAWGGHLMQNTLDEIFWAANVTNSRMTVWSLQEASNTYFWRDVGVSTWANNNPTSTTPDGSDWICKNFNGCTGNGAFPRNGVIGATRSGNQLWFAWSAGTDNNFQQAHIEMVTLDRNNNFNLTQQVQIWNNSYAFAYPALATNACSGEVGLSFEYGGNGNFENHVVGFWGDFIAYIMSASNVGTNRFGDYVTIRQAPLSERNPGNLFTAFGYGLNTVPPPGVGTNTDVHYVLFGRPAGVCSQQPR